MRDTFLDGLGQGASSGCHFSGFVVGVILWLPIILFTKIKRKMSND
jgi:hypothetical protein